jgi:hypothetical protein
MTGYCGPVLDMAANQIGVEEVSAGKNTRGLLS